MIAAEQWYEHQDNYQKYGFDMQPRQQKRIKPKKKSTVTSQDKARIMLLTVVIGMIFIGIIIANAYAASVKYGINDLVEENAALQGEVQNIEVQIHSANNIETIEKKAIGKLGMVVPSAKQCIYLTEDDVPKAGFAATLKEDAYN